MGNVDNVFVPLPQSKTMLTAAEIVKSEALLDKLIALTLKSTYDDVENSLGSALSVAYEMLKDTGGRVLAFSTKYPNIGEGRIEARQSFKLYGTEKERVLYTPLEGHWEKLADKFAKAQITVDMFLFPTSFIESATLGIPKTLLTYNCRTYMQRYRRTAVLVLQI